MRLTMRPTLRVVRRAWPPFSSPRNCRLRKSAGVLWRRWRASVCFVIGRGQPRGALSDVRAQRLGGRVAERHVALLLSLAAHQDRFVGPVNVVEIQRGQFGVADAAAVKHFENRLVARGPACCVVAHRIDHAVHLLDGRHARQMLGQARSGHERCCILLDVVSAGQPLEPAADGGKRASRRGLRQSALIERAQVSANVRVFDAADGQAADGCSASQAAKSVQLAPVGTQRMRRCAALGLSTRKYASTNLRF